MTTSPNTTPSKKKSSRRSAKKRKPAATAPAPAQEPVQEAPVNTFKPDEVVVPTEGTLLERLRVLMQTLPKGNGILCRAPTKDCPTYRYDFWGAVCLLFAASHPGRCHWMQRDNGLVEFFDGESGRTHLVSSTVRSWSGLPVAVAISADEASSDWSGALAALDRMPK